MRRLTLLFVLAFPGVAVSQEVKTKPTLVVETGGHTMPIHEVLFTPDSKQLITVSGDKTIRFWSMETGEQLRVLRPPFGPAKEGILYAGAVSPDGKTLAVAGYGFGERALRNSPIYLIDLAQGSILRTLKGHAGEIHGLAFSPDGLRLASAGHDGLVRVQSLDKAGTVLELKGQVKKTWGVAFSPDGKQVAGRQDGNTNAPAVRIWDLTKGAVVAETQEKGYLASDFAWSRDGKTIATCDGANGIRLWNPDGTLRKAFKDYKAYTLAFSADSAKLLFTWPQSALKVSALDLATGKEHVAFEKAKLRGTPPSNRIPLAVSPDGSLVASRGASAGKSENTDVSVWKSADGSLVHLIKGGHLLNPGQPGKTGWSADGKSVGLAVESGVTTVNFSPADLQVGPGIKPDDFRDAILRQGELTLTLPEKPIRKQNIQKGAETIAVLNLPPEAANVSNATFLGKDRVVLGTGNGALYLFNATSGELIRRCHPHQGNVTSIAPSPDDRYVVSSSNVDKTLAIWNPEHDRPLLTIVVKVIKGKKGQEWVAWTPEGYYATSPGGEQLIAWHVSNGPDKMGTVYPAAKFRASMYRPDVIQRLLEFGSLDKALEAADKARGQKTEKHDIGEVLPPQVGLTAPAAGLRLAKPELEIKAVAQSVGTHPVTALQLLLDGRPYQGGAGIVTFQPAKLGKVEASWKIALTPGPHRLSVLARCAVSSATSDEIEVTYEPATAVDPKSQLPGLYVLAVGINTYPGDWKLNCAANDALEIQRIFKAKAPPVFREVQTKLLTDKDATRQGVLDGFAWLKKQMKPQDIAVIFYAGHGARDAMGRFYLLPCDVDFGAVDKTGVSGDDVKKRLAELPGRVLMLLDACHSGAIGSKGGLTDELTRELSDDDCGVVVMCAAMGREEAGEERKLRHGYFALAVIEGLSGKADVSKRDGRVYLHHLEQYVIDRVQELSNDEQHPVVGKPTTVRSFALAKP